MPAVMNAMCAPRNASAIRSRASSAAALPMSGLAPAPRPVLPNWITWLARERASACASVFITMKSTPCTPRLIMCCTALPPAPPTPTTLMIVPLVSVSSISKSILPPSSMKLGVIRQEIGQPLVARQPPAPARILCSEISQEPIFHASQTLSQRAGLHGNLPAAHALRTAFDEQTHRCRITWIETDICQTACVFRHADTHRLQEDVFAEFDHTGHHRCAAGQHHAAAQQFFVARLAHDLLHEREQFFHARFDHTPHPLPRHRRRPRLPRPGPSVHSSRSTTALLAIPELPLDA